MPNWTVTDAPITNVSSNTTTILAPTLTIVAAAGYTIAPENFMIGGATPFYPGSNTWVGGNVDNIVQSVTFTQDGLNVIATATCEPALFNAASDINIDIDENPSAPVTFNDDGFCITLEYPFENNSTVTFDGHDNIVETVVVGDSSTNHKKKISGFGSNFLNHQVASVVVQPGSGFNISSNSAILDLSEGCENAFTINFTDINVAHVYSIKFTSTPTSISTSPCEFNNTGLITNTITADSVASSNTVHGLSHLAQVGSLPKSISFSVKGDAGTQYKAFVRRSSDNHYYNWDGTFSAGSNFISKTINSKGLNVIKVKAPKATVAGFYEIWLEGVAGATLATGVPTAAGQSKVHQFGTNSTSLTPITEVALNASGGFGTLPASLSLKRPARYEQAKYSDLKIDVATFKGKSFSASTKVSLFSTVKNLKAGMYVIGDNIPHNTIVSEVFKNHMIISNATTGAIDGNIKCITKTPDLTPFSFTIVPTTAPNTLTVNTSNNHFASVFGLSDVRANVQSNQIGNSTIVLANANGIIPGMGITGTNIAAGTTVSSVVHSTNTVTLSSAHTGVLDKAVISFKGNNNPSVFLEDIRAVKVGSNIVISGYLKVTQLDNSTPIQILLDDIINAT